LIDLHSKGLERALEAQRAAPPGSQSAEDARRFLSSELASLGRRTAFTGTVAPWRFLPQELASRLPSGLPFVHEGEPEAGFGYLFLILGLLTIAAGARSLGLIGRR
jgi:hypothetical protein